MTVPLERQAMSWHCDSKTRERQLRIVSREENIGPAQTHPRPQIRLEQLTMPGLHRQTHLTPCPSLFCLCPLITIPITVDENVLQPIVESTTTRTRRRPIVIRQETFRLDEPVWFFRRLWSSVDPSREMTRGKMNGRYGTKGVERDELMFRVDRSV